MKVSYKGIRPDLSPKLQEKLDVKFAKISKLLEKRGEKEVHVVVTNERHIHKAEITMQFYDHPLVGIGNDPDLFTAMNMALDKLDKQAVKQRAKWREKTRRSESLKDAAEKNSETQSELIGVVASSTNGINSPSARRVYRVNHDGMRKPMTLDEALMEMEEDQDYVVYRDADKECVSVLVRRRDGHFDLIES